MSTADYDQELYEEWLRSKKSELLNSISAAQKRGEVDTETLEIMKNLVDSLKVKTSMADYFKEGGDGQA